LYAVPMADGQKHKVYVSVGINGKYAGSLLMDEESARRFHDVIMRGAGLYVRVKSTGTWGRPVDKN
jgi:hypothetical protein